ncbi:MAG TPA: helical backbone metal receptor [Chitinophagaceae bacterium]|nr:helical backbone metal receptor [Chitinophagaceae bacterium]
MPSCTDQTGRTLSPGSHPSRIISLVPSQTELLASLGLEEEVVGITRFCIHPERWFQKKARVGGTKQANLARIHSLAPDLILANREENERDQVEELARYYPVWVSDIATLADALDMILRVGRLVGREPAARQLAGEIQQHFNTLEPVARPPRACYLIWQSPYMTVGSDSFIHAMMEVAGLENIFRDRLRYPIVTWEEIRDRRPDLVLLSSEPFPFKASHQADLQSRLAGSRVLLVDGTRFSWYGSRLMESPAYFRRLRTAWTGS